VTYPPLLETEEFFIDCKFKQLALALLDISHDSEHPRVVLIRGVFAPEFEHPAHSLHLYATIFKEKKRLREPELVGVVPEGALDQVEVEDALYFFTFLLGVEELPVSQHEVPRLNSQKGTIYLPANE